MDKILNKKQRGYVKDIVKTGNGTKAVLNNYNIKNEDTSTASVISTENLNKPHIQREIVKLMNKSGLGDDDLLKKHQDLLNKKDDNGIDVGAVSKGLDMAYKIKGHYTNEKKENDRPINIAVILNSYDK